MISHGRISLIAWLVVLGLGAGVGGWTYPRAEARKLAELVSDAERGAVAFSTGELAQLSGTPTDMASPVYARVKARLMAVRRIDSRVRFSYLMRRSQPGAPVIFLADSEPEHSKDVSLPGDVYEESADAYGLQAILTTGEPQWEGPLHDSFGQWITGYAVAERHPDGSVRDVFGLDVRADDWHSALWGEALLAAAYVWFALGVPLGIWGAARRHVRLAGKIRELSEALEQSSAAVALINLAGNITYVSGGYLRQTLRRREEIIGRRWAEFAPTSLTRIQIASIVARVRSGKSWRGEWQNSRADGTTHAVYGMVSPVRDAANRLTGFIVVFEDVTSLKRVEADLRRAKESAEAANEAKSRFLAMMSHEIRTPLNGIIGMASVLERVGLKPEQRDLVQVIQRSGETLLVIINDILDLSRIEADKIELEDCAFGLVQCIQDVTTLFRGAAALKHLTLMVDIDAAVPAHARGDIARFRQVLSNLVSNAVKFTEKGSVSVAVSRRSTSAQTFVLEVRVTDTGMGIPSEKRDRLFGAFSQVDASITRRFGGTGLGLVICKRLCELMQGDIRCESEMGKGSQFIFTVTLGHAVAEALVGAAPTAEIAGAAEETDKPLRILLVEDNAVNRVVAQRMLGLLGYTPHVVTDGEAAVQACLENEYDVILMDLEMPTLDGISATKRLRAEPLRKQPWIIALTADALIGNREKCLAAGMNDYVTKPIVMAALEEAFQRCAERGTGPTSNTRGAVVV